MRICIFATPGFCNHEMLSRFLTPYLSAGLCDIYYRTNTDEDSLKTDACIKAFALKNRLCYTPFTLNIASELLRMKHMFDYVICFRESHDETLDKIVTLIKLSKFKVFCFSYDQEAIRVAQIKRKYNKVNVLPTIKEL
jgi:hypothetical protein